MIVDNVGTIARYPNMHSLYYLLIITEACMSLCRLQHPSMISLSHNKRVSTLKRELDAWSVNYLMLFLPIRFTDMTEPG